MNETAGTAFYWFDQITSLMRANLGLVLLVLLVVVIVLAVMLLRQSTKAAKSQKNEAQEPKPNSGKNGNSAASTIGQPARKPTLSLRLFSLLNGVGIRNIVGFELALLHSFSSAMRAMRSFRGAAEIRYSTPWYLIVGPKDAGASSALRASNLHLPLGDPRSEPMLDNQACQWWMYEHGVVIEPDAAVFGLPEEGREPDRLWRRLARLLQWYRPKRPLDGIIVALPADLFTGINAQTHHDLGETGKLINRRLGDLQRRLGISLPVYVVITKCDRHSGFSAFWQAVPDEKQQQIFGWSTPYSAETIFKEVWLDEAMAAVRQQLNAIRLEQAAMPASGTHDDASNGFDKDAFLFPVLFNQIAEPLNKCLKHILYSRSSDDIRPFRGLYFVGDPNLEHDSVADTAMEQSLPFAQLSDLSSKADARPRMMADLLAEKIFREKGLVRPLMSSLSVRNRQVRLAQTAVACFLFLAGTGLAFSSLELNESVEDLEPSLRDIRETILALQEREKKAKDADAANIGQLRFFDERDTSRLLDAMAQFETEAFGSIFMPTSWDSDVNDDLAAFLSKGFDTVLMRSVYNQLNLRTEKALAAARDERARANSQGIQQAGYKAEVERLERFVGEMETIERLALLYNELSTSRNLDHLNTLLIELFDTPLPEKITEVSHLVRAALAKVDYEEFRIDDYIDRATTRARQLTWDIHDRLFKAGALEQELLALARTLNMFLNSENEPDTTNQQLADIGSSIETVDRKLRSPEFAWAWSGEFDIGSGYTDSVSTIAKSRFFDPDLAAEMIESGKSDFDQFRVRLGAYASALTGWLLDRENGHTTMVLSKPVVQLTALSKALYDQPFMAIPPSRQLVTRMGAGEWLSWDPKALDHALKLYGKFDHYAANELEAFPQEVRGKLFDLARARLGQALNGAIAEAQLLESRRQRGWAEPASGSDLERRVDGFAAAAPRLDRLIRIMAQLSFSEAAENLVKLAQSQATTLLIEVDGLLQREPAYEPRYAIDQWDGDAPATAAAYAFADDMQARAYLDYERERMSYLSSELARPLLDFLDRHKKGLPQRAQETERRWRAISDELQKYDKRHAESAVAELERFIRFDLGQINRQSCGETSSTGGRLAAGAINYFIDRLRQIESLAYRRCNDLVFTELVDGYNAIASEFNTALAGRFPFGDSGPLNEADPGVFAAFLKNNSNRLIEIYRDLENVSGDPLALEDQYDFVEALLQAGAFFQAGNSTANDENPTRELSFERSLSANFRVLRDKEIMANHILSWRVDVARNQAIDLNNTDPVIWRIGDPIRLSLRWAANAPNSPEPYPVEYNAGASPYFSIDGNVVRFSYGGQWSLLRLLEDQRRRTLEGPANPPFVLGFGIETVPAGQATYASTGDDNQERKLAQGFWQLTVKTVDGKAINGLPVFPTKAPLITSTAFQVD